MKKRTLNELNEETGPIANLVRMERKKLGYTQQELAKRIGVGLRFLKELEQGKKSLRLDKVTQVLNYFGYEITPVLKKKELLSFEEMDQ
jgi:y4mF family transcriptional regulator